MTLTTGQLLTNRYRITRRLHVGGMGAVYEAHDLNLNLPVAVKENAAAGPDGERQFKAEALLLAQLQHPNLPRVTDHFVLTGEGQYLVMELIPGYDLQHALDNRPTPFTLAELLPIIQQVTDALTYLHTRPEPIIHRDIKPANIRITPQGRVYLVDFGISKKAQPGGQTTRGARAVTPGFSPPEQYGYGRTDARSDIYALAATVYALLNGTEPPESVNRYGAATLPDPPGLPAYAAAALARGLALDPDQRFGSAAQFLAALQGRQPVATQRLPAAAPAATGRRRWLIALPMLLLLGVGAFFGWRALAGTPATPEPTGEAVVSFEPAQGDAPTGVAQEINTVAGGEGVTVQTTADAFLPATDPPPSPTTLSPTPEPTATPSPVPTDTPLPPTGELLFAGGPFHIGDEDVSTDLSGSAWESLTGACLSLPFDVARVPAGLTLSYDLYQADGANLVLLNDVAVGTLPQMLPQVGATRPDYWRDGVTQTLPADLASVGRNVLALCAAEVINNPDFAGDRDDFRVRNVRLMARFSSDSLAGLQPPAPPNAGDVIAWRADLPPALDGDLSDWPPAIAPVRSAFRVHAVSGWDGSDDVEALWFVQWDDGALYFAALVSDNIHVQTRTGNSIFQGDSVEIQIDSDLSDSTDRVSPDDYQLVVSPGDFGSRSAEAVLFRATASGNVARAETQTVRVAARRTATGYALEIAVPWGALAVTPAADRRMGLALSVNDNDTPGTAEQETMYSHVATRTFLTPSSWGGLLLAADAPQGD